jgi:hypothetical protein
LAPLWTVRVKKYSPGLLKTLLIWMQVYFIVFCRPQFEPFELRPLWPGLLLGLLAAAFLSLYMPLVATRLNRNEQQSSTRR